MGKAGIGSEAGEGSLQLAHVGREAVGEELKDVSADAEALGVGLGVKDGHAGVEVGRLDVGDEAALEPRAEPLVEGWQILRATVAGEGDWRPDP